MFDDYAKKLQEVKADVPKIFKNVALRGAKFAENKAKDITDREALVDTGNYKRNWFANHIEPQQGIYGVLLENNADYASHLEWGHKTRNGGRVKGKFVGQQTIDDTHFKCLEMLDSSFEKAFKKYHYSFTEPKE